MEGNPISTKKNDYEGIFFSKEQFNVGLRLPLPSLLKQFLHHPGADGMQHLRYAFPLGPLPSRGHFRLYRQEGKERHF